MIGLSFVVMGE